jgi:SAM-dependent methyltransferase
MTWFLADAKAGYNEIAEYYADRFVDELDGKPVDRALFGLFAELVQSSGGGPVADVGCGPGRVTRYLHSLGLNVFGIDLSAEMLAIARRENPDLRFSEGSMTALELEDASLSGILAKHSIIHVPLEHHGDVIAEFHRALVPGGYLMLVFQVGDEPSRFSALPGVAESLVFYRLQPDRTAELLVKAGFDVRLRTVRAADPEEKTPHAFPLARRIIEGEV